MTKTWHHKTYPAISPSNPSLSAAGKTVFITGALARIPLTIDTRRYLIALLTWFLNLRRRHRHWR